MMEIYSIVLCSVCVSSQSTFIVLIEFCSFQSTMNLSIHQVFMIIFYIFKCSHWVH